MYIHDRGCVLLGLGLAFSSIALAEDHPPYLYKVVSATAVELTNTIGNDASVATDINNFGEIAGWAVASNGAAHSFLYHTNGVMQDISGLVATSDSYAAGINDFSEIVGGFIHASFYRPFYWHASTGFTEMDRGLVPGDEYNNEYSTWATAINDYHHAVGKANVPSAAANPPYSWINSVSLSWVHPFGIPSLPYSPFELWSGNGASDISNSGWIVGNDQIPHQGADDHESPFDYKGYRIHDGVQSYVPKPPGAGNDLGISGVNESGAVVGSADVSIGRRNAIFWSGNTTQSQFLGVLPGGSVSGAYEVNDQNFVAGYSYKSISTSSGFEVRARGFIWHSEFGLYELPTPFEGRGGGLATNCQANSLNNLKATHSGLFIRVVGYCTRAGRKRAIRWDVVIDEYRLSSP